MTPVEVLPLRGFPEVKPGDDLATLILRALRRQALKPRAGDVLSVSQKVVSKAEGAVIDLRTLRPSPLARAWAGATGKDPRHVELILRETRRAVRVDLPRGILIMETHHGFVCANAGVDRSNAGGRWMATVLPQDPDASAARLRRRLAHSLRPAPGVLVVDTFGRPWRRGLVDVVLGASGVQVLEDQRGRRDPAGYRLHATVLAQGDALAAASQLAKGKLGRVPVTLVRWPGARAGTEGGQDLIRVPSEDLFR